MPNTGIVKYHVKLKFEVDGLVEKADIIGAIFGQTEGLLGPEMNLNELQKVSKVGRIEVNVDTKSNMARGDAVIPMSTDISTAALIAAAIESIDKVGPFQAKFALSGIDDIRAIKKKVIVDRAKRIVQEWATKTISEGEEMLKDVYDASKPGKLTAFGKAQLACGTGVFESDWIILVEGRADVINLLRAGFDNAIAIEGAKIDETIVKLTQGRKVIAFLDGDRAGDLILKELHGVVAIDKVLRAPIGREVEDCTPLEIAEILKEVSALSAPNIQETHPFQQSDRKQEIKRDRQEHAREVERQSQAKSDIERPPYVESDPNILSAVKGVYPQINETLEAVILDGSMRVLLKVPVSDVVKKLDNTEGGKMLVLDGIVTQRLVDAADKVGIEFIVGHRTGELRKSGDIQVRTFGDMGISN
ncbi:DNA primase DnaG [Nitrososphaera sp. AFS]|uniref:DNA primase DnaG n=1 Tax=Nitrososphaera sp. AFS TaxID=2301191 RepID=UPI0013921FE1|nr:DNA primase DnaG [Nitrososphaera sp. AFS]NAL78706.1 DNA primase [Nitrososphaera sp. AFS]